MRGRIRSIKPESLLDEKLWDLEAETGLPLFRCFVGLWMYADREGRFEWRPRPLKGLVLPYWDGRMEDALEALEGAGFVQRYEVDGRTYGLVTRFKDHQTINAREAQSRIPAPPVQGRDADSARTGMHVHAHGEGKGREGKGARVQCTQHPALSPFEQVERSFQSWRKEHGKRWKRSHTDYSHCEHAAEVLAEEAQARGSTIEAVAAESLRGFAEDERARAKGYPFPWWARDPLSFLGPAAEPENPVAALRRKIDLAEQRGDHDAVERLERELHSLAGAA